MCRCMCKMTSPSLNKAFLLFHYPTEGKQAAFSGLSYVCFCDFSCVCIFPEPLKLLK